MLFSVTLHLTGEPSWEVSEQPFPPLMSCQSSQSFGFFSILDCGRLKKNLCKNYLQVMCLMQIWNIGEFCIQTWVFTKCMQIFLSGCKHFKLQKNPKFEPLVIPSTSDKACPACRHILLHSNQPRHSPAGSMLSKHSSEQRHLTFPAVSCPRSTQACLLWRQGPCMFPLLSPEYLWHTRPSPIQLYRWHTSCFLLPRISFFLHYTWKIVEVLQSQLQQQVL